MRSVFEEWAVVMIAMMRRVLVPFPTAVLLSSMGIIVIVFVIKVVIEFEEPNNIVVPQSFACFLLRRRNRTVLVVGFVPVVW